MRTWRTPAVLLVLVMLAGCREHGEPPPGPEANPPSASTATLGSDAPAATPGPAPGSPGEVSFQNGFAAVVARVAPAVVNVSSEHIVRPPGDGNPFFGPFFHRFGERGQRRGQRMQAVGSGVIVSADGYVLTNNHVIENASSVRVALTDRREIPAKVVGSDPKTDVALLKLEGSGFTYAPLGDSAKVRVGQFALAMGNPFGLGQTVTFGIISATGRGRMGIADYEDFLQTDAAINPGNSGGPLVDATGEVIGINTAIVTAGGGGSEGIGFAVPSDLARAVMRQILQHGRVVRGWLGVAVQDITPDMALALGDKAPSGAVVAEVAPGSPADRAGLKRGDIVVSLDGAPVLDASSFRLHLAEKAPGTKAQLGVMRAGRPVDLTAALGELREDKRKAPAPPEPAEPPDDGD
jgi:serine protease Do